MGGKVVKYLLLALVVFGGGVWANNSSLLVGGDSSVTPKILAHRGLHQTYHRRDLQSKTCTADRIDPPSHDYMENTIPSMQAAFDAGADVVELDVYLTADKRWAVFHDWTVDCRTNASGKIRDKTMAELKSLDIGYGYTADGGKSFPFRGRFVGMMPELHEVFDALPGKPFLVNFKSEDPEEGQKLAADLKNNATWRQSIWAVYGSTKSVAAALQNDAQLMGYSKPILFGCLKDYALWGWTGRVPQSCAHTKLSIPSNVAPWLWGWPHKFTKRMKSVGTDVILMGPYSKGDPGTVGIDAAAMLESVPAHFDGYVWTNKVQDIAPLLQARGD
nr:glycerophosphodiester phosphodiesterase family protein [uncultured Cohaesibacter sp.]